MQPEIQLGPVELKTFGLMFALGFLAAGALIARRFDELGKPVDWAYEMIFAALVGGLVGARVYYLAQNWDDVSHDVFGNLFSGSGLVWYGGAIGGALAVGLWARWRGFWGLRLLDLAAPGWRSATRSAGSAASSRATATTASPRTCRGRCRIRTARCRPSRRCTRRRSTRRSRWGSSPGCCGRGATASGPAILFAVYLVLSGLERFLVEFVRRNERPSPASRRRRSRASC